MRGTRRWLPLPFQLRALDAQGRVIDGVCSQPADGGPAATTDLQRPRPATPAGRWRVGRTQGPPGERFPPRVWRLQAAPGPLDVQAAYRLGANSCIVKPVEFEKFMDVSASIELYRTVVNQRAYRSWAEPGRAGPGRAAQAAGST